MSGAVTFKVGDRVRTGAGDQGTINAIDDRWAWVFLDDVGPTTQSLSTLTLIPPAPVAVSWRNVYDDHIDITHPSRDRADCGCSSSRLGVIVGYSDGTYKLEVVDQ